MNETRPIKRKKFTTYNEIQKLKAGLEFCIYARRKRWWCWAHTNNKEIPKEIILVVINNFKKMEDLKNGKI